MNFIYLMKVIRMIQMRSRCIGIPLTRSVITRNANDHFIQIDEHKICIKGDFIVHQSILMCTALRLCDAIYQLTEINSILVFIDSIQILRT